jgi:hypothetical protein
VKSSWVKLLLPEFLEFASQTITEHIANTSMPPFTLPASSHRPVRLPPFETESGQSGYHLYDPLLGRFKILGLQVGGPSGVPQEKLTASPQRDGSLIAPARRSTHPHTCMLPLCIASKALPLKIMEPRLFQAVKVLSGRFCSAIAQNSDSW